MSCCELLAWVDLNHFSASAAGKTSWSPQITSGTNSVFSQALIEGLEANGASLFVKTAQWLLPLTRGGLS